MIIFKNANLYNPTFCGKNDILIDDDGKILKIGEVNENGNIIDCKNMIVCPMFVDGHEHISLQQYYSPYGIIENGVCSVVGVLTNEYGENFVQKNIKVAQDLVKFGIDTYCLAGSKTYRKNIYNDIVNNSKVIGVKTALNSSTVKKSKNPTFEEFKSLVLQTFKAGQDSNKKVQVHVHLETEKGDFENSNLNWIDKIVVQTGVSYSLFKLTHAQKYGEFILQYANKGCYLDYTAMSGEFDERFYPLIDAIKNNKIDKSKISISSDLGILHMEKGLNTLETPYTLINTLKHFIKKGLNLCDIIPMFTSIPGSLINEYCGRIKEGECAKLLVIDKNLNIIYNSLSGKIIKFNKVR